MGPCAHHRIIAIINNGNDIKHLILDFIVFFCVLAVMTHFAPIRFYKQTTLRTEAFTQSRFAAQRLLHTEVFTQRRKYLHSNALYEDAFARINKGT